MVTRVMVVAEQLRRKVPGGIGTHVSGLMKGLAACTTASGDAGAPIDRRQVASEGHGWGPLEISLLASRAPRGSDPLEELGYPVVCSRLPSRILTRAWDHDLLRAPSGIDLLQATSLAFPRASRSVPVVVSVHDLTWRGVPEAFPARGRRWHERAFRRAVSLAAGFVVPSEETAADLASEGIPRRLVEVVGEGGDHLPPGDQAGTARLLGELGVHGDYLLSVGTLEPRKNLERLFEACRMARERLARERRTGDGADRDPPPLVVVGPRGWGPRVKPDPGVRLAGTVSPAVLSGLYARALCLVYVPLAEGFGLPVLEAMTAGTPVIASPTPSATSSVLQVDPLDTDALAAAIVEVVRDLDLRSDLARRSVSLASSWTWAHVAERHLDAWRRFS